MEIAARAALLVAVDSPLVVDEVRFCEPGRGQVLISVDRSAVCRSQLMEASGQRGNDPHLPHLLGHEGIGVVVQIGAEVNKVKPGDRVVLSWTKGVGIDADGPEVLRKGKRIGAGPITTFSNYTVVAENRVTAIPPDIPEDSALFLGCSATTGLGMVMNRTTSLNGCSVAVVGLGGVGLFALIAAFWAGAESVHVIDSSPSRLNWAQELWGSGVNVTLSDDVAAGCDILESMDFVFESTGSVRGISSALSLAKPRGGTVVFASHPKFGEVLNIDPFDLIRGKKIYGTWGGESNLDRDISRYGEVLKPQEEILKTLTGHSFALEDINEAFEALKRGNRVRPVIQM